MDARKISGDVAEAIDLRNLEDLRMRKAPIFRPHEVDLCQRLIAYHNFYAIGADQIDPRWTVEIQYAPMRLHEDKLRRSQRNAIDLEHGLTDEIEIIMERRGCDEATATRLFERYQAAREKRKAAGVDSAAAVDAAMKAAAQQQPGDELPQDPPPQDKPLLASPMPTQSA